MPGSRVVKGLAAAGLLAALSGAAGAQTPAQPRDPNMPAAQNTIPEKIDPPATSITGSTGTLSEKLSVSEGVIRPDASTAPGMVVRPPVSDPGTTPVIRPPGEPGGNPNIQPK